MLMLKRMMLKQVVSMVSVTAVACAVTLAAGGCQETKKTGLKSDPVSLEGLRASVAERNPNSNVGVVSTVLPDGKYAAVTEVPLEQFKKGDVVTFVDASMTPLANGTVRDITASALHVEVEPPLPGGRPVAAGDLALRFKP